MDGRREHTINSFSFFLSLPYSATPRGFRSAPGTYLKNITGRIWHGGKKKNISILSRYTFLYVFLWKWLDFSKVFFFLRSKRLVVQSIDMARPVIHVRLILDIRKKRERETVRSKLKPRLIHTRRGNTTRARVMNNFSLFRKGVFFFLSFFLS